MQQRVFWYSVPPSLGFIPNPFDASCNSISKNFPFSVLFSLPGQSSSIFSTQPNITFYKTISSRLKSASIFSCFFVKNSPQHYVEESQLIAPILVLPSTSACDLAEKFLNSYKISNSIFYWNRRNIYCMCFINPLLTSSVYSTKSMFIVPSAIIPLLPMII